MSHEPLCPRPPLLALRVTVGEEAHTTETSQTIYRWPKWLCNPRPRKNTWPCPADQATTAGHDLLSKSLLKSAPLLIPHASAVAFFFMALLMARPFIAAFFITLLTFFAFMAFMAFIAFMAAFFMAPAFFIAAAFFMAAMTRTGANTIGWQKG